jgi:hypothetical protein
MGAAVDTLLKVTRICARIIVVKLKNKMQINTLFATLAALSHAFAHPGHDVSAEAAAYERALAGVKRNLDHCSETLMKRGISGDAINRRAAVADVLREKRGPESRWPTPFETSIRD